MVDVDEEKKAAGEARDCQRTYARLRLHTDIDGN
jgi:hypothetical protein